MRNLLIFSAILLAAGCTSTAPAESTAAAGPAAPDTAQVPFKTYTALQFYDTVS